MNKIIYIAIIIAIFGCNQSNKKKNSANSENTEEVKKSAKKMGFTNYAEDPVVLTMGADGEFDAGALGSMTIVKVAGVYHMYYDYKANPVSAMYITDQYVSVRVTF